MMFVVMRDAVVYLYFLHHAACFVDFIIIKQTNLQPGFLLL